MPSSDEILAAIDSAVDDWEVSDDAVRMLPPGAPKPVPANGYTAEAGRWVYSWDESGEVSVLQVHRDGQPWGVLLPQQEYVVSDGEHTAVMHAPPRGDGVWFAAMTEPGVTPEWQRLDGWNAENTWLTARPEADMTFWADRPHQPGELSITLHADCHGFTDEMARLLALLPATSYGWVTRRHVVKGEYSRRLRNRRRSR